MLLALAEEADAGIPDDTSADAEIPGCTNMLILGHTVGLPIISLPVLTCQCLVMQH